MKKKAEKHGRCENAEESAILRDGNALFSDRIVELAEKFGGVAEIARMAGASEAAARKWKNGESEPGLSKLVQLSEKAGVSLDWLATGKGSPYGSRPGRGGISDTAGDYSIYKVSPSIDRDKIASLILLVEQRMADALPPNMKARMAADLIIQHLEGENDESK